MDCHNTGNDRGVNKKPPGGRSPTKKETVIFLTFGYGKGRNSQHKDRRKRNIRRGKGQHEINDPDA